MRTDDYKEALLKAISALGTPLGVTGEFKFPIEASDKEQSVSYPPYRFVLPAGSHGWFRMAAWRVYYDGVPVGYIKVEPKAAQFSRYYTGEVNYTIEGPLVPEHSVKRRRERTYRKADSAADAIRKYLRKPSKAESRRTELEIRAKKLESELRDYRTRMETEDHHLKNAAHRWARTLNPEAPYPSPVLTDVVKALAQYRKAEAEHNAKVAEYEAVLKTLEAVDENKGN